MRKTWIMAALLATAGFAGSASASSSFISDSNAHAGLITIAADGTISVTTTAGKYDNNEDTVYNVVNNSNVVVTGFTVSGTGISDFDLDGINNYVDSSGTLLGGKSFGIVIDGPNYTGSPSTDTGPTNGTNKGSDYVGYANGARNTYTFFTSDNTGLVADHVDITFGGGGLTANGGTAFISFEEPAGASGRIDVTPTAPLPASVWGGLALILGIAAYSKFAKLRTV